ncbi:unnamed protein product [Tilletia controversa]|nr:unnamed protein product [Tilletia controversa]CAD6932679.1 unnamed protein product [Tilletia controversa]CAD6968715.1 unnamed protein product [Tilletia controversa]
MAEEQTALASEPIAAVGMEKKEDAGVESTEAGPSAEPHTQAAEASSSTQAARSAERDADTAKEPLAKRPRRDPNARSRGLRMFGLVTSTLKKVANENEKRMTGEAGKRRAEIDERMKQKLQRETDQLHSKAARAKQDRADVAELTRITNAIAVGEADFRVRKAQKRRLASFLCVKVDVNDSVAARRESNHRRDRAHPESEYLSTADYATDLPFALEPLREGSRFPVYYLPAKLLPSQEDELDEQEDRVDRLIDDAETEWRERRARLEERSKQLRERIMERRRANEPEPPSADVGEDSIMEQNGDGEPQAKAQEAQPPAHTQPSDPDAEMAIAGSDREKTPVASTA